jgi:hypothetical protein
MAVKETKTEKPKDTDYDSLIEDLVEKIDNENLFLQSLMGFMVTE